MMIGDMLKLNGVACGGVVIGNGRVILNDGNIVDFLATRTWIDEVKSVDAESQQFALGHVKCSLANAVVGGRMTDKQAVAMWIEFKQAVEYRLAHAGGDHASEYDRVMKLLA